MSTQISDRIYSNLVERLENENANDSQFEYVEEFFDRLRVCETRYRKRFPNKTEEEIAFYLERKQREICKAMETKHEDTRVSKESHKGNPFNYYCVWILLISVAILIFPWASPSVVHTMGQVAGLLFIASFFVSLIEFPSFGMVIGCLLLGILSGWGNSGDYNKRNSSTSSDKQPHILSAIPSSGGVSINVKYGSNCFAPCQGKYVRHTISGDSIYVTAALGKNLYTTVTNWKTGAKGNTFPDGKLS